MSVLVLAECDKGALAPATARLVGAAARLGPVDVLVAGPPAAAAAAASLAGVATVLVTAGDGLADNLAALLETLAPRYTWLLGAASSLGKDVMPRLAARLDIQPVTDIVAIEAPDRFTRPIYAGNALETLTDPQERHVLTLRAAAFPPAATAEKAAPIETLPPLAASLGQRLSSQRTDSDAPDLATARIVVGGGVAVGSAEGFRLIETLAQTLGAAIGATRAAVDAGYAPNDWQVGQTGKVIAPELYIAIGISGALQHLAGIAGARRIVAINTDPDAPLMRLADLALVGDLFEVVPRLIAELEKRGMKR